MQLAAVLVTVKDKSLRDGACGPILDRHCARRHREGRSGRGDGRQSAEQGDAEMNQGQT
jgi:hypothetical protein